MHGWRAFAPVLVYLSSMWICQHCSLYLRRNRAVPFQVGACDAKLYGPRCIWSKNELRGSHTCFSRKAVLNPFTQPELQSISGLLIGRQNNNLGKIGVREFWIVRKEETRSARPNVSRNDLCFGLQPQPLLYFFRARVGGFYAGALR